MFDFKNKGGFYNEYFFQHNCGRPYQRDEHWLKFFDAIADRIVREFRPQSVLDAGCAMGFLVEALRKRGVEAFGVDISEYAIANIPPEIQPYCWVGSVTEPFPRHYGLIVCIEVLEHLPPREAEQAVENFCRHAEDVLFSSTPTDFKEPSHVNVQPPEYWAEMFSRYGFYRDFDFDASFITPWAVRFKKRIEPLGRLIANYERRLWWLAQENKAVREQNVEQCSKLAEQESQINTLTANLAEKDQMLRRLESQVKAQQEELVAYQQKAEQELKQLRLTNTTLEREVGRLQEDINQLQEGATKIIKLKNELERKDGELQKVSAQLAALQASLPLKILAHYNRWRQRLLPEGSHRYKFYRLFVKAGHIALDEGLPNMFRRAWRYFLGCSFKNVAPNADYNHLYQLWIEKNEPKPSEFLTLRKEVDSLPYQPRISITMPVYNVDEVWLRKAIESVRTQIYPHWELCIADDGSTRSHIRKVLERYRKQDDRIKVTYLSHNQGISVASNAALALATGEFVGLLDHDDELAPWALLEVVKCLNQNPDLDFINSDEDKLEPDGRRSEPFFKPDFSPDLLMSMNYICHFSVFRRSLLTRIGGFRKGFEGSQDYDVILRVTEQTCKVAHIPKILYHWRKIPGSASGSVNAKSYAYKAAVRALEEALERRNIRGDVTVLAPGRHRVRYEIAGDPLVSIIIPTRDRLELLRRCIESIREKTTYRNYEIVVVDNGSEDLATIEYLHRIKDYGNCRVVAFNQPFNYSCINNFAVAQAKGTFLVFLNNDTEVITPEWLEEMLGHAQRKEVGAVGAKLLFPNNTIQHGGVIVRLGGVAGHAFYGLPASEPGYMALATVTRNCAAVTGACMMLRRAIFEEVGGFDEELDVAYNDVDLCLQIIQRGYYIVWTPHAMLYHHESATRGNHQPERNIRYFCEKWRDFLKRGDPFYNPNLALDRSDFMVRV